MKILILENIPVFYCYRVSRVGESFGARIGFCECEFLGLIKQKLRHVGNFYDPGPSLTNLASALI